MTPNAHRTIAFAVAHLGTGESPRGSNDGERLRAMLKGTRFEPGQAWCMYFAIAALQFTLAPGQNLPKWFNQSGDCEMQAFSARESGHLSKDAATGAIMLLKGTQARHHHAGIVIAVRDNGRTIHTIEGNTNTDGSSEGYGVFRHVRPVAAMDFIVWDQWP